MRFILHLRVPGHTLNGNPRRLYALVYVNGTEAKYHNVWDEGYGGMPTELRELVKRGIGQLPDLEITPKQYRELKKEFNK